VKDTFIKLAVLNLKFLNLKMNHTSSIFSKRQSIEQVEEGNLLAPKFDSQGVIPCVTTHSKTKEVLMFAFMDPEALKLTIETGLAHYWSRSRKKLWKKGESSGMFQHVQRMLIDDDQDCIVIEVELTEPQSGGQEASCHVGYRSCFYREVPVASPEENLQLKFIEDNKAFNPNAVYGDIPNPTQL
jgi:phosphoribosyl-AMP cyclohydrolase